MTRTTKIVLSFVTVCLAWGASYFAIRVGLKAMPPLGMGAVRYGIAGSILWLWCDAKGEEPLSKRQWLLAALLGLCFVVIGNGTVLWAEQTVPSGVTALLVAVTPVGTLLLEWVLRLRKTPNVLTWLGLLLGLTGVGLLVAHPGPGGFAILPVVVVLLGTLGWSLGSTLSVKLDRPLSPIRAIASQMLAGAVILLVLSGATREDRRFHFENVSLPSVGALLYLVFVASIAAYIAYGYLMYNVSPTAAGACSYVNPVVAMLLGACFGEKIGGQEILALGAVLAGVALVSTQELRRAAQTRQTIAPSELEIPIREFQEACA